MKYLIAEDFSGLPVPFIFPDRVAHTDMREQLPYTRILSAGEIIMNQGEFLCSGGDAELAVLARPEDAQIIKNSFLPTGKR
ncbi:hypothetical protein FACS1894168_2750 [Deltaproteobacteria bacterium]|nr:hypothetical protein FACS1894168_2750 [Deltaproteobacteria bacterium]